MKRSLLMVLGFSLCALAGCAAEAGDNQATDTANQTERKSVKLQAEDGTKIELTYAVATRSSSSDEHTFATNVVLKVSHDAWNVGGAGGGRAITAVVMSPCAPSGGMAEFMSYSQELAIPYGHLASGSGFGYELQLATQGAEVATIPMFMRSIAGANHCRQEIAVVVDGTWLVDPINTTHNFKFQLDH